jgi:hypothetical protein
LKIYQIPKSNCPLRVQMSDNEVAAAIQCRGEDNVPFYWLPVSTELARMLILEHGMKLIYELPDTPQVQIRPEDPSSP